MIPRRGLIHVWKAIEFDGEANNGNLGDLVPVFTTTGIVAVETILVSVTEALVCSAPTGTDMRLYAGSSSTSPSLAIIADGDDNPFDYTGKTGVWDTDEPEIWSAGKNVLNTSDPPMAVSANIALAVTDFSSGADITDGTLRIDAWYYPITDDGHLAGDDDDEGLIDGLSIEQALRVILAAAAGELSGAATTTVTIRDIADTADRIVATVDASGNRSATTIDGDLA